MVEGGTIFLLTVRPSNLTLAILFLRTPIVILGKSVKFSYVMCEFSVEFRAMATAQTASKAKYDWNVAFFAAIFLSALANSEGD